jgi:hypothetical protein
MCFTFDKPQALTPGWLLYGNTRVWEKIANRSAAV